MAKDGDGKPQKDPLTQPERTDVENLRALMDQPQIDLSPEWRRRMVKMLDRVVPNPERVYD